MGDSSAPTVASYANAPDAFERRMEAVAGAVEDAEAISAAAAWIRSVVGEDVSVELSRPDPAGRLRVTWGVGRRLEAGRRRAAQRRAVFETKRPVRMLLSGGSIRSDGSMRALAMFPLKCRGACLGVLEIESADRAIEAGWQTLQDVAHHLSIGLCNLSRQAQLTRQAETFEQALHFGRDLIRARTPEAAVRTAVRFVARRSRVPVAGWCAGADGRLWLVEVGGLGPTDRRELRRLFDSIAPWGSLTRRGKRTAKRRFAKLTGASGATVLDAGSAVLLAGRPRQFGPSIDSVGSFLAEVLPLLGTATDAEQRKEQLDMGIAWAAHELRGPLMGVRAVLELLLQGREGDPRRAEILRQSLGEVDRLAATTEAVLGWASGAQSLHRRATDVVQIVEEVVGSCRLAGSDGFVVFAPDRAIAHVDADHVRVAIGNLLRNARKFAEPGTKIEVSVEEEGDHVTVSVKNTGPEIPASERERIFDPFVRGNVAGASRNGSGLGLFITRRVVAAHGGRISVESEGSTTTFRVMLPVAEGSSPGCVS